MPFSVGFGKNYKNLKKKDLLKEVKSFAEREIANETAWPIVSVRN